jgi:hypothetical protein
VVGRVAVGEYLPPLVTELKADISGLKKGFDEAKAAAKKYKEDIDGISGGFRQTKTDADGAGKAVSDFERLVRSKMRTGETAVSAMRNQWDLLHRKIKDTRAEMAKPGGGTDDNHAVLRGLIKDAAALGGIAADFGIKLGDATGKALANGAAVGGPYVQAAIVTAITVAVALAAPIIGAAIAAAITFGLAGAVIGLGAYILKENPRIKKAWEKLTETSSGVFGRAAAGLEGPFVKAINFIGKQFLKWEPTLKKIFDAAGPLVQPLTEGVTGFIANMLPGILDAVKNAQPAFEAFKTGFPAVGAALGEFFRIITENKDDIKLFTSDALTALAWVILAFGHATAFLTTVYGWIRRTSDSIIGALKSITKTLGEWWNATKEWVKNLFDGVGQAIMSGMVAGIKWKAQAVKNEIVGAVKGAWEAAKSWLQTGSPSRRYMELGRWTAEGYARGIDASTADTWASLKRMTIPGAANPRTAAAASAVPLGGGGATGGGMVGVAHIYLDGREIQQAGIKYAQRDKVRNTTTGWS